MRNCVPADWETTTLGEPTSRFCRGFSRHNPARFRDFYLVFPHENIRATLSLKSVDDPLQPTRTEKSATRSRIFSEEGASIIARMNEVRSLFGTENALMDELNEVSAS